MEEALDIEVTPATNWPKVCYTLKNARYIIVTCHMPTSWQNQKEWDDASEHIKHDIQMGKNKHPRHFIVIGGDMNCEWPQ